MNWNNRDAGKGVPSWMPESLNAEVDWVNKEWWDSYDVSAVWLAKRLRGSAGDRPAGIQPYMFMRHGYDVQSGVYHGSSAPSEEVFYRMEGIIGPLLPDDAQELGFGEVFDAVIAKDVMVLAGEA